MLKLLKKDTLRNVNKNRRNMYMVFFLLLGLGIFLLIKNAFFHQFQWEPIETGYVGYQKIIFVGDSRTVQMEKGNTYDNIEFVGKYGAGLDWFQQEGQDLLMKKLKGNDSPQPIAVIFNFEVNDYKYNEDDYAPYFQKIALELKKENCYLFYMSINPVEEEKLKDNPKCGDRSNQEIGAFNKKLKKELSADYTWLDMNKNLQEKGYATRDGLHYTKMTNSYILSHAILMMLKESKFSNF